jgi:hypothetical protein
MLAELSNFHAIANFLKKTQFETLKGKVIPLQAWTGPERFQGLRLPDFNKIYT